MKDTTSHYKSPIDKHVNKTLTHRHTVTYCYALLLHNPNNYTGSKRFSPRSETFWISLTRVIRQSTIIICGAETEQRRLNQLNVPLLFSQIKKKPILSIAHSGISIFTNFKYIWRCLPAEPRIKIIIKNLKQFLPTNHPKLKTTTKFDSPWHII